MVLDKATSNLRLETDWPAILQICDLIRQGDVQPKYALAAIKKKLYNANPHIAVFGLQLSETTPLIPLTNTLQSLLRYTLQSLLRYTLQSLAPLHPTVLLAPLHPALIKDTVNIMKTEGFKFPALKESDAMFSADTAPEWADADCCHRCRVAFGVVQRKHHCRACGQVFCAQCSSKTSTVPKFGFEKEVRVCEACYDSINNSLAQQNQAPPRKTEEELREEEEFQLALALSQAPTLASHRALTLASNEALAAYRAPASFQENIPSHEEEVDPELARYLNRSLWNQRKATAEEKETSADREKSASPLSQPSAPVNMSSPLTTANKVLHDITNTGMQKQENGESDSEIEEFVAALKGQVEIFVNRMKSNSSRGRCIANDSSVQTLFMNITAMHSRLLRYIQQQDDSRVYYEGLQDKLTQVKDARAALDALREEHREKLRRQAEEAERIRQMQMAHKLEIMRKKKQDYLQRIQEQERERQMRQEQQKQQYLIGTMPSYPMHYLPSVQQQGYTPGTVEGPPVHGQFGPGHMMPGNPYTTTNIPGTQMGTYPHYPVAGIPGQSAPPGTHPMQGPPGAMHHMMRGPMMQGHIPGQHPQGPPQQVGPHMQRAPLGMQGPPQVPQMQGPPHVPQMRGMQGPPQAPQMQGPPQGMQGPPQGPQMQGPPQGMHGPPQAPQMQGPPQGMQGPPQGMQGPPQAPQMQGPPQGMQGPPQGPQMQGPPQGMQGPPQGPQMQGPPQGMQGPPQGPQMQGPPQGMQAPPQGMQGPPQAPQMQGPPQGMQGPPQQSAPPGSPQQPPPTPQQTAELISFD
uniref:Hepatocyte growth factor-regulated tyrosine kinase substrate n=1 Tax=Timema genevievae TaxID=629358 RepID=A0A7R9PNH8_TIMGE|nr:unnamed protein product [Timema genevievae]